MFELQVILISLLGFIISFILTLVTLPWIIRSSIDRGLTTVDAHKPGKPTIAEPGGLAPLISFIFSILIAIFIISYLDPNFEVPNSLLAGVLSIVIGGLLGFFDDVFRIRWRHKIILGFLPAIPLMALEIGTSTIDIPLFGIVDFGHIISLPYIGYINLYSLVILPLAVNFAFNSFNMLAGFNGLEAGNGIISLMIILVASLLTNNLYVAVLSSAMIGGYIVLLKYNWYPAKTLIGNTGTLSLGTAIIVGLILGNMDRLAIGLFFIHFINFLMFFLYLYTRQEAKIASINEKTGHIIAPCPYTMYWIIPYFRKNTTEKQNVIILLVLHTVISLTVFIISLPYLKII